MQVDDDNLSTTAVSGSDGNPAIDIFLNLTYKEEEKLEAAILAQGFEKKYIIKNRIETPLQFASRITTDKKKLAKVLEIFGNVQKVGYPVMVPSYMEGQIFDSDGNRYSLTGLIHGVFAQKHYSGLADIIYFIPSCYDKNGKFDPNDKSYFCPDKLQYYNFNVLITTIQYLIDNYSVNDIKLEDIQENISKYVADNDNNDNTENKMDVVLEPEIIVNYNENKSSSVPATTPTALPPLIGHNNDHNPVQTSSNFHNPNPNYYNNQNGYFNGYNNRYNNYQNRYYQNEYQCQYQYGYNNHNNRWNDIYNNNQRRVSFAGLNNAGLNNGGYYQKGNGVHNQEQSGSNNQQEHGGNNQQRNGGYNQQNQ